MTKEKSYLEVHSTDSHKVLSFIENSDQLVIDFFYINLYYF